MFDTADFNRERNGDAEPSPLPTWALRLLGYSLFLWSSLIIVPVSMIGPDLIVTAFVYLAAGMLLQLHQAHAPIGFLLFGLTLGVGYWSKAIMFPIALVFLVFSIIWIPRWKLNLCALLAFGATAAPLLLALSLPRGRFTFGDSGLLNYSSMVSPGGRVIHWQGLPAGSGTPKHPTREIHVEPLIYEFNGPVPGTYPPSYDPSYWNEGRRTTFSTRAQLSTIGHHIPSVFDLLFVSQAAVTGTFLFLLFWNSKAFLEGLRQRWELVAISVAIILLYMCVHFETRFVRAFVVLIWLSAFAALRLSTHNHEQRTAGLSIVGLSLAMLLFFASNTAKKIVNECPDSVQNQLEVAHQIALPPESPVAVVGAGNYSYWAHFADLRIVAEITSSGEQAFWQSSRLEREKLYDTFRLTGAKWIIGQPPNLLSSSLDSGWERVGATGYYRYPLFGSLASSKTGVTADEKRAVPGGSRDAKR